jgi:diaminopimelate epimerase
MVVVNADGSIPEMCGNGLRCAALHVARARGIAEGELVFDTGAGLRACVIDDRDARGVVTIDMGIVRVSAEDVAIDVDGDLWTFAVADAGNPHAVTMRRADRAQMEWVGRRVATHAHFPTGTNVEFARYGEHDVDLVVYERGVGITMACGTGACATVAVGVARGHLAASEEVRVRLPGGSLYVSVTEGGRVTMRGPARHVFSGEAAQ